MKNVHCFISHYFVFLILGAKSAHLLLRLKTHEGQQTCALIAFKIHEKILNADFKSEKRNVAFSMRKMANREIHSFRIRLKKCMASKKSFFQYLEIQLCTKLDSNCCSYNSFFHPYKMFPK